MDSVLWYVLTGTRGGDNRARVLAAAAERPRNPNRLAEALDLDYKTVRHHLDVLVEHDIVASSGDEYGAVYDPTDQVRDNWDVVEEIFDEIGVDADVSYD